MMDKRKVRAVPDRSLSDRYSTRYVIVDMETGEILDDAQGYGYRTAQKAYACWGYKTRDKSRDAEKAEKRAHIRAWMKENRKFMGALEEISFEIWKGSWGPEDRFNAKLVSELLKEWDLHPDFTAGELLREWGRHPI